MNGNYYQTPVFLNDVSRDTSFQNENTNYNMEQSYIENILRNNIGKKLKFMLHLVIQLNGEIEYSLE